MPDCVTDDGIRLHYEVRGEGAIPVIYLHWMGGDISTWRTLWDEIGYDQYAHVGLDFRGHGASERKPSTFTNERLARDVLQLADALELQRFVLVGHSFGGKVALTLAALAPIRVRGLVLVGSVGPRKVPLDREALMPILDRANDLAFLRDCFRPWFSVWPRTEIDRSLEQFAATPDWARRAVCEIALWSDLTSKIGCLNTPALIIAGAKDPVYGPEYQRTEVLLSVPHARIVTIDSGHGLVLERPEEIAMNTKEFLARIPR